MRNDARTSANLAERALVGGAVLLRTRRQRTGFQSNWDSVEGTVMVDMLSTDAELDRLPTQRRSGPITARACSGYRATMPAGGDGTSPRWLLGKLVAKRLTHLFGRRLRTAARGVTAERPGADRRFLLVLADFNPHANAARELSLSQNLLYSFKFQTGWPYLPSRHASALDTDDGIDGQVQKTRSMG
jgi:hypothetical protein